MDNVNELIKEYSDYFGVIYMLKNNINGLIYVGQTTNLKRRIKEYRIKKISKKSQRYRLMEDIVKFGYNNFTISIIDIADDILSLHQKEIDWINMYDSRNANTGYNSKTSGIGGTHTEETKFKMSESSKLFRHTEETKLKKSIPIIVFKSGRFKYYNSAKLFADELKTSRSVVSSSIRNCKVLCGYRIFYWDKTLRDKCLEQNKDKRNMSKFRYLASLIGEDVETIEGLLVITVN